MDKEIMPPTILYKYRRWDDTSHKKILTQDEIFFASPIRFNDPFDCTVPIRFDKATDEQINQHVLWYLENTSPHINKEQREEEARKRVQEGYHKNPNIVKGFIIEQRRKMFESTAICSLTKNKNNLVMWSHYANSHKGFCVGFNTMKLLEFQDRFFFENKMPLYLGEVNYLDSYPFLNYFELNETEKITEPILIKSNHWKYEEEYRLILAYSEKPIENDKSIVLNDGVISEVILGCKMEENEKQEIIEELRKRPTKIDLFQAKQKEEEFGLYFEKIDY